MKSFIAIFTALLVSTSVHADEIKIATWNIANLHHEDNVALRDRAEPRDQEDYDRLAEYASELNADIIGLQEIGSPAAIKRIFSEDEYHIFISDRYNVGDENRPPEQRDIFTGFAISKDRFPTAPAVSTFSAISITNVEMNRGVAVNRPTRAGMIVEFEHGGKRIKLLNVHLKSSCHGNSLNPVFDERTDGSLNWSRFDCRTLAAQNLIMENWIEQQQELGNSVIVVGDFNRRLNLHDNNPAKQDHFWADLNDGNPDLTLSKGPLGKNTNCWVDHDKFFYEDHIDFIVFDDSLDDMISAQDIKKVPLPHENDPKYQGYAGQKISDHCPVVGTLN